jgi:hypothetical protein
MEDAKFHDPRCQRGGSSMGQAARLEEAGLFLGGAWNKGALSRFGTTGSNLARRRYFLAGFFPLDLRVRSRFYCTNRSDSSDLPRGNS